MLSTKEYIETHIKQVRKWISYFSSILLHRAMVHDESKLVEPEYSAWKKMDEEPRYPYGTKEYKDKLQRFNYVFQLHWKNPKNRHHPEHFESILDMDLVDLIEMLCDWLGYRSTLTYTQASELVNSQCDRYNFSEDIRQLILNTFANYFVSFGGIDLISDADKAIASLRDVDDSNLIDIKV